MKGDFSRQTFDPLKQYSAVLPKQGAVNIDADQLEAVEIAAHLRRTALRDVLGRSGAPADNPGFELRQDHLGRLVIGSGRYYVDGILCENHHDVPIEDQPNLSNLPIPEAGRHLAYLRVWERHVTAIEDPGIREVALGGPDTSTRLQALWQVGLVEIDEVAHCLDPLPQWDEITEPPDGRLSARARPSEDADDPCLVPPNSGFYGLANSFFRVEIHEPGVSADATFLWDRDNGSTAGPIAAFVDGQPTSTLRLGIAGNLDVRSLEHDNLLEITDDLRELNGQPGLLRSVDSVQPSNSTVLLNEPVDGLSVDHHPKARLWSGGNEESVTPGGFVPLENGVEIRFEEGTYRTGDYWCFPARTATGDIEWPTQEDEPLAQPPHGIEHHYTRLALIDFSAGGFVEIVDDCRQVFEPLAQDCLKITSIRSASDNQVLPLNGALRAAQLRQGLVIDFSAPLSGSLPGLSAQDGPDINPAVEIQLALPEPPDPAGREFWGAEEPFGFRWISLAGGISLNGDHSDQILWRPSEPGRIWLDQVFARLIPPGQNRPIVDRLVVRARVLGNFVWADGPNGEMIFLDGETKADPLRSGGLDLPSGEGRPGGDFFTWFQLLSEDVEVTLNLSADVRMNVVSGIVSSGGAPVEGADVILRRETPPVPGSQQETVTDAVGGYSFTALEGTYTVIAEALGTSAEREVHVLGVIIAPPGGGPGAGGGAGTGGGGTPPPNPGGLTPDAVIGIGAVRRELLASIGVNTVAEFVSTPRERLAEALDVSGDVVEGLLLSAGSLLGDEGLEGDRPVIDVSGVGRVRAADLEAAGIVRLSTFLTQPRDRLVQILGISGRQVDTLLENARLLLRGEIEPR